MTSRLLERIRTTAWIHPAWFLATKAAFAAVLSWAVVQPFGGFADKYPYYAPLGAIVAVSTTIVGSVRSSAQAELAIVLGAAVGLAALQVPAPEPVLLGIAILVATFVSSWGVLGANGSWAPVVAMFVLIIGNADPLDYVAAYGGLTALGAVVGIGVDLVMPQLPLTPATLAQDRLRAALADQLDQLATALDDELVTERDWSALRRALAQQAREANHLTDQVREAARANWSAPRWSAWLDRRAERDRALQRLSGSVDEVVALVAEQYRDVDRDDPTAEELRCAIVGAFRAVAGLLRQATADQEDDASPRSVQHARSAVEHLHERLAHAQATGDGQHLAAAAIALNMEQAVDAWS